MLTTFVQIILVGGTMYFAAGASVLLYQMFHEIKNEIRGK